MDHIETFKRLFCGNSRSYGRYNSASKKLWTEEGKAPDQAFEEHLNGGTGLGIVPIMDDGNCWFGAIDIDAHGDAADIDLIALEETVRDNNLPLAVCRSKSGGAHLYLFGSEPLPAKLVRVVLAKWARDIGYGGVEIFPKQDVLIADSHGRRQMGNWINLCWHDAYGDSIRYSVEGGKKTSFEYFLELAESKRISAARLVELSENQHQEAPPCIQKMFANGVTRGQRNEALYNIAIYMKKALPETWRDRIYDVNARMFDQPLPHSEAKKVALSVARRDYKYRCKEEPCRSLCNSSICVTRKYGITPDERGELEMGAMPEFGPLEKINTDPVRWNLYVDSQPITITTDQLLDFRDIRKAIAEVQTRLIPPIKNDRWQSQLHTLMDKALVIDAPGEASPLGIIESRLIEFFNRTDLSVDGMDRSKREHILLGAPVVQYYEPTGTRAVFFRGTDFIDYLRKNRSEDLRGPNLWMALRKIGVEHTKIRIKDRVVSVWFMPVNDHDRIELTPAKVTPEL